MLRLYVVGFPAELDIAFNPCIIKEATKRSLS